MKLKWNGFLKKKGQKYVVVVVILIKDYKGTCFEKEKMCMDKSIYIKYCNIPLNKKS